MEFLFFSPITHQAFLDFLLMHIAVRQMSHSTYFKTLLGHYKIANSVEHLTAERQAARPVLYIGRTNTGSLKITE